MLRDYLIGISILFLLTLGIDLWLNGPKDKSAPIQEVDQQLGADDIGCGDFKCNWRSYE